MPRASIGMFQLAVAVAVTLTVACRPAAREDRAAGAALAPLTAADQAAIRATDTAFVTAANAGDAAGLAAQYLADASLMPPNAAIVQGHDGIEKFWGGLTNSFGINITLTAEEVEGRGDLAYSRGRYILDLAPKVKGAAPAHDEGKFLEILRRQPDGTWRYAIDMYSSDLPTPK